MDILLVGGTGFIGSWVAEGLRGEGHDVTVLHRGHTKMANAKGVSVIQGHREKPEELTQAIERVDPDVVVDFILYTQQQAQGLLSAVEGRRARLVVLSSSDVYRNYDGLRRIGTARPDPVPLDERAPLRESRYPYRGAELPFDWADAYDKILVEEEVRQAGVPATVLRLPAVYGPGDSRHRVGDYLRELQEEGVVRLPAEQATWRWTRGYVEDVAQAIAVAATRDEAIGETYNVGEEVALQEREWIEAIADAAGWHERFEVVVEEDADNGPMDFAYDLFTDTARIRRELGFRELMPRRKALEATIQWERQSTRG